MSSPVDPKRISREIDAQLAREKVQLALKANKEPRILVLGSGDSGKTTFMKQLKILHGGGYGDDERRQYRKHAADNIADSVQSLLAAAEALDVSPKDRALESTITKIVDHYQDGSAELTPDIAEAIEKVWADENMCGILPLPPSTAIQIQDTAGYFLSKAVQLADQQYLTTNEDILNLRIPTTQITETIFIIEKLQFKFYDVGGQLKHRKHWAPYFDNVHNILFFISLASYDQVLVEDPTVNRMHDAMNLFGQICNHPLLKHIPITLFMNKKDLFEKKLATSDVKRFFPDFSKECNFKNATRYFERKFRSQNQVEVEPGQEKSMFCHVTCCTDTGAMAIIIASVVHSLLVKNLQTGGMM
ncbi:guanine nucleotide binding protein, alpha subunit [Entophlyctis helioformis]|nr:guanine nucleotide binding protein, alpha subunit [Entophlyctis helioformis]